jgi:hypothetical protein
MPSNSVKVALSSAGPLALAAEIHAFEERRVELEQKYLGKFVLFHGAEFVGAFEDLNSAAKEAIGRFGRGPYLIRKVGVPPTVDAGTAVHIKAR